MSEYNVIINEPPSKLGIIFNITQQTSNNNCLYLEDVITNSTAHKLGLLIGDQLISVNDQSVLNLTTKGALQLFHCQSIPFKATFKHCVNINLSIHNKYNRSMETSEWNIKPKKKPSLYQTPTLQIMTPDLSPTDLLINTSPDGRDSYILDHINVSKDIDASPLPFNFTDIQLNSTESMNNHYQLQLPTVYDNNLTDSDHLNISVSMSPISSSINDILFDQKVQYEFDQSDKDLVTGFVRNILREFNIKSNSLKPHKSRVMAINYCIMNYYCNMELGELGEFVDVNYGFDDEHIFLSKYTQSHGVNDNVKINNKNKKENNNNNVDTPVFNDMTTSEIENDVQSFILSSNGFKKGKHEWIIKILKCDIYRQEIGIISKWSKDIIIDRGGITDTPSLGARAFIGNELCTNSSYYASYNSNNKERIFKDLSHNFLIGWVAGDEIKICLDCDKGNIKFFLNNQKVRKTISIQKNIIYFPIISFCGNCKYEIVHFQ